MSETARLEDHLCYALYAVSMQIGRIYKPHLDRMGITYPQYLVLTVLWEDDGKPVGAIAERLALDSSTVTPLVKRLEAGGLVTRARPPEDERRVLVSLTEKGRALQGAGRRLAETLVARSGMRPDQLMELKRQVQQLNRALAETG